MGRGGILSGNDVLDVREFLDGDRVGTQIAEYFNEWENYRNSWLAEIKEIRDYIYATDSSSTSSGGLPWKNSVHIPKLCQIRDNLLANYMATIFPNDRALVWEGDDADSESVQRRQAIQAYMLNKLNLGLFKPEMQKCLADLIDTGNCFAMTEFVAEEFKEPGTDLKYAGFVGPKMVRISYLDIVFNPTATSFKDSPKIIREVRTLGSLKKDIATSPEKAYLGDVFDKAMEKRRAFALMNAGDSLKTEGFAIDGFGSFQQYFGSNYCELLHFYGDLYDPETGDFKENQIITVLDRSYVLRSIDNPSWLGRDNIHHCGWRLRPDNIYAQSPLANLVGMQYRIDHLENAKSDAVDLMIQPVIKVKGEVDDFDYGPSERIYTSEDGDVEFMRPDWNMLNADTQIQLYMNMMEEMAGAPKQAMGFRTPGEKTAYEVQSLENSANRIFQNKTTYVEEIFMEPILNSMLELARRNMSPSDVIRVMDDDIGVVEFMKVTREDIASKGKIRPVGARHFARNANIVQNLTQFANSPLGQDKAVLAHVSGKKLAHLMQELLGLEQYGLVQDNIRVAEELETAKLSQAGQQLVAEQGAPESANAMGVPPQGPGTTAGVPANSQGQ